MISIVICSIDPDKFAAVTQNYAAAMGEEAYEIVAIHDARSLAEGYNRGIARSRGEIVIFSHDDIEIVTPDFPAMLKAHLRQYDVVGPAGTSKLLDAFWPNAGVPHLHGRIIAPRANENGQYSINFYDNGSAALLGQTATAEIQALDGCFIAVRREVLERLRFDERTCDGFHVYDVDFTYSAYLAGFRLAAFTDIGIMHFSAGAFDATWERYAERFLEKHANVLLPPEQRVKGPQDWSAGGCASKEELAVLFTLPSQQKIARLIAEDLKRKRRLEMSGRTSIWKTIWATLTGRS